MTSDDPHQPPPFNSKGPIGKGSDGLVIAGYITGLLLPIVGFFIGFALILKDRVAHGVLVMVLSVAVVFAAWAIATTDTGSTVEPASTVPAGVHRVIQEQNEERERATVAFDACVERLGLDIYGNEKDRDEALNKC